MRSKARRRVGQDMVALQTILDVLPSKPTIVELGANNGATMARFFAACAPTRYVAVDADPRNVDALRAVVATLPATVRLYAPLAVVGEARGPTVELRLSERRSHGVPITASSTLLTPGAHLTKFPYVVFEKTAVVAAVPLEDVLDMAGLREGPIDLLWLDIEGSEQEVLKALPPRDLARIGAINMEAFEAPLHEGAWSRAEAVTWLSERGFTLRATAQQDIFLTRS